MKNLSSLNMRFLLLVALLATIVPFNANADKRNTYPVHQVATANAATNYTPIVSQYKYSQSEIVYTKEDINLPENTYLFGLYFKGYNTDAAESKTITIHLQNTDDVTVGSGNSIVLDSHVKVFEGEITFPHTSNSNFVDMLYVEFQGQPFIYTGGSLRVVVDMASSSSNSDVYFEANSVTTQARVKYSSNEATFGTVNFFKRPLPVMYVLTQPYITGNVTTYSNHPIANANVTVNLGSQECTATTDNSGNYRINVEDVASATQATVSATATGYEPSQATTITFNNLYQEVNLKMHPEGSYDITGRVVDLPQYTPKANFKINEWNLQNGTVQEDNYSLTDEEGYYYIYDVLNYNNKVAISYVVEKNGINVVEHIEATTTNSRTITINFGINEDGTTTGVDVVDSNTKVHGANGAIVVESTIAGNINVYNLAGSLVRSAQVTPGSNRITDIAPGIYFVNHTKVIVK